jgi:hypothetical protein
MLALKMKKYENDSLIRLKQEMYDREKDNEKMSHENKLLTLKVHIYVFIYMYVYYFCVYIYVYIYMYSYEKMKKNY